VDIVTAGSPIRRFINHMLPNRLPTPAVLCKTLREGPSLTVDRWFNVCRHLATGVVTLALGTEPSPAVLT